MKKVYVLMHHDIDDASSKIMAISEDKEVLHLIFKQHWYDNFALSGEDKQIIDGLCDLFRLYEYHNEIIGEEDCWWIEEQSILEIQKASSPIVAEILFDVVFEGQQYKDLDFGYHNDETITYNYIHHEDGPWGTVQVGNNVMDFQIYGNDKEELKMQACMMTPSSKLVDGKVQLCWDCSDYIDNIEISNIRVKYSEPICHIKPKK